MTRFKPSPTFVIAIVALFVALAGSAYAVSSAPKDSVTSRSIRDGTITGVDVKADSLGAQQVNESSLTLPQGPPGPPGEPGAPGAPGPAGTALAYAHIGGDYKLDASQSKNVTLLKHAYGTFCLDVTAAQAPRNAVATVDFAAADARKADAAVMLDQTAIANIGCPAGTDAAVATVQWQPNGSVPTVTDASFFVSFN